MSAPAGSGKTVLLRSWIAESGLGRSAGWVSVGPDERDPQRFWLLVFDALRDTDAGSALVRQLTAAPDLDPWAMVEWLLEDLSPLGDRLWLVVDDVHELRSGDALRQLELLLMRAPPELRFVLATRHDLRLGLHRLRLEGGLTEIRADALRFSPEEARTLFAAAGVELNDHALVLLHERTEGWAAGLRLAALLLAGHPHPERFAAEFSGTERTVAEYLLAEVLEHQPENVRRLLLRTSVLERVNGPLADLLTRAPGGERILQELETANAFVVSLDTGRSWFRYHQLFADLLQMELRRSEPGEIRALHSAAAEWFAGHGYPVEAVRHAQLAEDWSLAARLLSDRWLGLVLDGQAATAHELLTGFPPSAATGDAELAAVAAGVELTQGSLEDAEQHLALAETHVPSVAANRRVRFEATVAVLRLQLARQLGDVRTLGEEANRLLVAAGAAVTTRLEPGQDLRAVALINLGIAEFWTNRFQDAGLHLDQGIALARQIGRPYLELTALSQATALASYRSYALGAQRSMQAVQLAERHGWSQEPTVGVAYAMLGVTMVGQARLEEAERWLSRAERTLRLDVEPMAMIPLYTTRGLLEVVSGRLQNALAAYDMAERSGGRMITQVGEFLRTLRARRLQALVMMGETERCERALAGMDDRQRQSPHMAIAETELRLAEDNPEAALNVLAPVIDGSAPVAHPVWKVEARVLEAIVQDALGDTGAAGRALESALALAEPDGLRLPFLLHPAPGLLERHRRRGTAHRALVSEILDLLAGNQPAPRTASHQPLLEPLSGTEVRVLRYLPTNLSQREIASELHVSVATVKTHIHHAYAKLGVHDRRQAVDRARDLGLLAPALRGS